MLVTAHQHISQPVRWSSFHHLRPTAALYLGLLLLAPTARLLNKRQETGHCLLLEQRLQLEQHCIQEKSQQKAPLSRSGTCGWDVATQDCIQVRTISYRTTYSSDMMSQGFMQTPGFCNKLTEICFALIYILNSLLGFIPMGLSLGLCFHSLKVLQSYSPVCFPVRAQHVSQAEVKSSDKNVKAAGGPSAEQTEKQLVRAASTLCNYIQICP